MNGASLPTVAYKTERELWSWHATFQKEKIRIKTLSDNAMHASCHLLRSSMVRYRVTPICLDSSIDHRSDRVSTVGLWACAVMSAGNAALRGKRHACTTHTAEIRISFRQGFRQPDSETKLCVRAPLDSSSPLDSWASP